MNTILPTEGLTGEPLALQASVHALNIGAGLMWANMTNNLANSVLGKATERNENKKIEREEQMVANKPKSISDINEQSASKMNSYVNKTQFSHA